ncbi:uncharacterized protein LOC141670660 [Apium graveolens]|uniref:uncharacterized protein LOC141670660 n=1 Tax=Apium graveolens TaxID=4045 RepID=UPI003D7A0903
MIFSSLPFISLLILVLANSTCVHSFSNNVTDQQALLSFKASITVDPLGVLSSWNTSMHFCQWIGVICSRRRERVTVLNLSSQRLVGTLSSHIGNLSFLREIYLGGNDLHGSIPNEIGRLYHLQHLYLGHNSFQGGFPTNLSHCVNIRNISMQYNNLKGKLPTQFASWSKLNFFSLGNNHFTGSIPPSIGNLSSLGFLVLQGNNLAGKIPMELYNISTLYTLGVDFNELEGSLPADFGFTLPMLQNFIAGVNRFVGRLPSSIVNASNLAVFDISHNNITGPVPMNLGSLSNLQVLNLGSNQLGNDMLPNDLHFFDSLVNCTNLYELSLYETGLRGKLPSSIANLTTMEMLDMFGNHLYGSIPKEIGNLVSLTTLSLHHNFLTGTIPESIGELSMLGQLYLGTNNISGVIPASISNITQLSFLSLHTNMLEGSIPTGLFNISTLQVIDLFRNRLTGVIPEQIVGLPSQCFILYLDDNLLTGPLPSTIGSLKQLVHLYVSNNHLTGDIPASLGDSVMLEELRIDGNLFEGSIPSSFKNLKSLAYLDLSNDNISGSIPSFLGGLHMIQFLNLSGNKLGGEVPKKGLFANVSAFSVVGNLRLCGGIKALQLPACPVPLQNSKHKKKKFLSRIILVLLLLPLAILLACLAFIFNRYRRSKKMNGLVPVLQDNQYPRLSYQDLLVATNKFSLINLLGEGRYGSVYKGILQTVNQTVAVKVLNVEMRGASKSFLAECNVLRDTRHRNLIKIITASSTTDFKGNDFKALVFEFMTNGDLDSWLHPSPSYKGNERNLTLLQRLNICIDVALGVDHLHHHSHTSIIHCDIKPSNILLDEEFVARVGDFGLARFYFGTTGEMNQAQMSSTAVHGTVGYVPPEYGMGGEVSAEGDVYSYGILLLEMFSGRRPTGSSIFMDNANNLHDYVKKALPQRVLDIADPRIIPDQKDTDGFTLSQSYSWVTMEVCLASVFEVGILCSVETPKDRIGISAAIKLLYVARDRLQGRVQ